MTKKLGSRKELLPKLGIGVASLGLGVGALYLGQHFELNAWPLVALAGMGISIPHLTRFQFIRYGDFSAQLDQVRERADHALELAELAGHSALLLSHLNSSEPISDGYSKTGSSTLRRSIVAQLEALDWGDDVIEQVLRVEDPFIARNILCCVIRNRAYHALVDSGSPDGAYSAFCDDFLPEENACQSTARGLPSPARLRAILEEHGCLTAETRWAVDLYERWQNASPRFRFVLEHDHEIKRRTTTKNRNAHDGA